MLPLLICGLHSRWVSNIVFKQLPSILERLLQFLIEHRMLTMLYSVSPGVAAANFVNCQFSSHPNFQSHLTQKIHPCMLDNLFFNFKSMFTNFIWKRSLKDAEGEFVEFNKNHKCQKETYFISFLHRQEAVQSFSMFCFVHPCDFTKSGQLMNLSVCLQGLAESEKKNTLPSVWTLTKAKHPQ